MSFSVIARFVMSLVYLGCGIFLLAGNNIFYFSDFQKYGLAAILIAYGLFRFYSAWKKMKEESQEDDED